MFDGNWNKVLPLCVLPMVVTIFLLLAALRWRRIFFTVAAIGILGVLGTPLFADLLMRTLEDKYIYRSVEDCPQADAVFVFGGMLGSRDRGDGSIAWNEAAQRFDRAVEVVKAGKAKTLVLSGGAERYRGGGDEGQLLKTQALVRGVPDPMILVTEPTLNTLDEAAALCRLVKLRHWSRVLVVTSAFHMPRAMHLCQNCASELTPVPVAFETPDGQTSWAFRRLEYYLPQGEGLARSERALREYLGIVVSSVPK